MSARTFWHNCTQAFLNLLYPQCCIVCGEVLPVDTARTTCAATVTCAACAAALPALPAYSCEVCGRGNALSSIADNATGVCASCRNESFVFVRCFAAYVYEDAARDMILRYKSGGHTAAARGIATLLAERFPRESLPAIDLLMPVPSHKSRQKARGFSPTALIAEYLSPLYDLPCDTAALYVARPIRQQSSLNAAARRQNVENAYVVRNPETVAGKTILLFDDVFTTGATVNACAQALRAAGAEAVYVLVIAATVLQN